MNIQNLAQIENNHPRNAWPSAEEMDRLLDEGRRLHAASFSQLVSRTLRRLLGPQAD